MFELRSSSSRSRLGLDVGFLLLLFWPLVVVLLGSNSALGQDREGDESPATLRGLVLDPAAGTRLDGAHVQVFASGRQVNGAVSGDEGFYQVRKLAPGTYRVRVSFVGYRPYADTVQLNAGQVRTLNVELSMRKRHLDEVVVAGQESLKSRDAGTRVIGPVDLERIPTPQIGGGLAGYLKAQPGVVSTGDRGGRLFIRGSEPSQNVLLVDGLPVYRPFHIVGFYSAIPASLVGGADVYAGGFGARYNSRMSSVIDVSVPEGNKQTYDWALTASPFLVGGQVEGPIQDEMSVVGSFRRSILQRSESLYDASFPYRFQDAYVKLHDVPSKNFRYSVFGLHTSDQGEISGGQVTSGNRFQWSNTVIGTSFSALPPDAKIYTDFTGGVSYASNAVGQPDSPSRTSKLLRFTLDFDFSRVGDWTLNWGLFTHLYWMKWTVTELSPFGAGDTGGILGGGGYVEAKFDVTDRLSMRPGVVLTAYEEEPVFPQPRLRAQWQPADHHTFSVASGLYSQPISGVSRLRDAGSGFSTWRPASVSRGQMRALHGLGGWEGHFGPIQLALEGYYRRLYNLPVPEVGVVARSPNNVTRANGSVFGVDTRIEYVRKRLYASLSYTYSWTRYEADGGRLTGPHREPVARYHPPHDRRHQVNAVTRLTVGPIETSLRWAYGTGRPYTQFRGFDEVILPEGVPLPRREFGTSRLFLGRPYGARLPAYHRLDASVKAEIPIPGPQLTVQVGAFNLYDRANVFYLDLYTAQRVDQLPFLPYLSVKLSSPS